MKVKLKANKAIFQRQEQDGGVAAGSPSSCGGSCCPSRRGGDYDDYDDFHDFHDDYDDFDDDFDDGY